MLTCPSKEYIIYGTEECAYCTDAKLLLEANEKNYVYINVKEDTEAKQMFIEMGLKTVPQIFEEENFIGGYTELVRHFQ
jgi:glutaredoxin 1